MSTAAYRASRAAADVVSAASEATTEVNETRSLLPVSSPAVLAPNRVGATRLVSGILELTLAKHAYAVGATIVRTADEMAEEITKIV